eukprot:scpid102696/ scgid5759/ 
MTHFAVTLLCSICVRYAAVCVTEQVTDVPVMLLNADDDPVAPPEDVYHHARTILDVNPRSLFVHTRHGSHMAYYSGGCVLPDDHNVFDQMLLQYITAVLSMPDR